MERSLLLRLATLMCVAFFLLLTPAFARHLDIHSPLFSPSRKLVFVNKALKIGGNEIVSAKEEIETVINGSLQAKEMKMKQVKRERWTKWEEVKEPSDLFTMDYRRVSRRRPIHNKSLPIP